MQASSSADDTAIAAVAAMTGAVERFDIVRAFDPVETIVSGDWAFERDADGTWRYAGG